MPDPAKRIGIYWVHDGRVVGLSCPLDEAEAGIPGLLDSPFTHVDAWPSVKAQNRLPPHLEYDEIPRGRVLYAAEAQASIVYGDRALIGAPRSVDLAEPVMRHRKAIMEFFDMEPDKVIWRHDDHYIVGRDRIGRMLEEDGND